MYVYAGGICDIFRAFGRIWTKNPPDYGAIWCLDTHQEWHRCDWLKPYRLATPDSPGESAEMWADWDEMQWLMTRDLVSECADRESGRNR